MYLPQIHIQNSEYLVCKLPIDSVDRKHFSVLIEKAIESSK